VPFHDNGLLFLTTSLVIQLCDLGHDSRSERQTVFTLKCFPRHGVLKMQNSAPNLKKRTKGAQRNRE